MLGYDFEVLYRWGANNKVADALSRQLKSEEGQIFHLSTSSIISELLQQVQQSYQSDVKLQKVVEDAQQSKLANHKYYWDGRFLRRKGKIVVGRNLQLR